MGTYSKIPLWLAVKTDARWKTLRELVEDAKKSGGKFTVATFGRLTAVDFILELMNKYAGTKMVNVPYKSSGEALTAILGGHAEAAMVSGASGHLEAGTVRILAVAEEKRLDGLPDVPTFKEFGYPIVLEISAASPTVLTTPSLPGTTGTPAFFIVSLASDLSPIALIISAVGPMNLIPEVVQISAKLAFSARNP
jgi:tripartite-type tricarboxylate transporter receptor subunit TctC